MILWKTFFLYAILYGICRFSFSWEKVFFVKEGSSGCLNLKLLRSGVYKFQLDEVQGTAISFYCHGNCSKSSQHCQLQRLDCTRYCMWNNLLETRVNRRFILFSALFAFAKLFAKSLISSSKSTFATLLY